MRCPLCSRRGGGMKETRVISNSEENMFLNLNSVFKLWANSCSKVEPEPTDYE